LMEKSSRAGEGRERENARALFCFGGRLVERRQL
jgi:hypothetical protein